MWHYFGENFVELVESSKKVPRLYLFKNTVTFIYSEMLRIDAVFFFVIFYFGSCSNESLGKVSLAEIVAKEKEVDLRVIQS